MYLLRFSWIFSSSFFASCFRIHGNFVDSEGEISANCLNRSQTESNRTGGPKDSTSTKRRNVGKAKGSQGKQREEILRENFRDKPLVEFPFVGWNNHYVKHCTCTCIFYTCIFYGTRVDFRRWLGTSLKTKLLSKLSCYTLTSCLQQKECSDGTRNEEEEIG